MAAPKPAAPAPKPAAPKKEEAPKADPFGGAAAVDSKEKASKVDVKTEKPKEESEPALTEEKPVAKEKTESKADDAGPKRRVPEVVNSRAAMFGDAPDVKRDVSFLMETEVKTFDDTQLFLFFFCCSPRCVVIGEETVAAIGVLLL
jgi:hypothetical protein